MRFTFRVVTVEDGHFLFIPRGSGSTPNPIPSATHPLPGIHHKRRLLPDLSNLEHSSPRKLLALPSGPLLGWTIPSGVVTRETV